MWGGFGFGLGVVRMVRFGLVDFCLVWGCLRPNPTRTIPTPTPNQP